MFKETPLVSVIIPIYNVERYLCRCLDSILCQTYKNMQIILVDDGSTDSCSGICEEYRKKDSRITVVHKINEGLSSARNTGLDCAKGEYISFIDSDDYVDRNYIQELLRIAKLNNVEISMIKSKVVSNNSNLVSSELHPNEYCVKKIEKYDAIRMALRVSLDQTAWGKLYKKKIFDNIRYPKGYIYEDLAVFYNILDCVQSIAVSNAQLYYYSVRDDSYMHQSFSINHYNGLKSADMAMDFVIKNYPELFYQAEARRVYAYFTVLKRMLSDTSNRVKYKDELDELRMRINTHAKGLILKKDIKLSLKLRLLSYYCNEKVYMKTETILTKMIEGHNG